MILKIVDVNFTFLVISQAISFMLSLINSAHHACFDENLCFVLQQQEEIADKSLQANSKVNRNHSNIFNDSNYFDD